MMGEQKKIIIFGGGQTGAEALCMIGKENVAFFCDNDKSMAGKNKYDVTIIDYQYMLEISKDYIIVIAANTENALEISNQLESQGVRDYVFYYDEVKNRFLELGRSNAVVFFQKLENRLYCKAACLRKLLDEKQKQITYLKDEVDVYNLKKTVGFLRKEQIKNTQYAVEVLKEIKELCIAPFIIGGTLIGARRHSGFVPWDDDIDFGVVRADYDKLYSYAEKHWHMAKREVADLRYYRQINELLEAYPEEYIFVVSPYCASVYKGTSIADYVVVDFFVFDYFRADYDFNDYKKTIIDVKYNLEGSLDEVERLAIEQKAVAENQYIVRESEHIGFALDSMIPYEHLNETEWIKKEDIFPTKEVIFENITLPAPRNIDEYLGHEIPGFKGIPSDVGMPKRLKQREAVIRKILPTVEIYVTKPDEVEYFSALYEKLRKNSIYVTYVIENKYCNAGEKVQTEQIEQLLIDGMYEYKKWMDKTTDVAISSVDVDILWKYDTEKKMIAEDDVSSLIDNILELYGK